MSNDNKPPLTGGSPHGTTELVTFSECPQKHGFKYGLKFESIHRPDSADSRDTGTLVHVGLANFYGAQIKPVPLWVEDPYLAVVKQAQSSGWMHLLKSSVETVREYIKVRSAKPVFGPIVAVEDPCETYIATSDGKTHIITTRLDLVAYYRGSLCSINHKTSVRLSYAEPDRAATTRLQFMLELVLARTKYSNVKWVLVNPVQTSRNREGPKIGDPKIVDISPHAFSRLGRDISFYKAMISAVQSAYPNPLDRPRSYQCMSRYGLCEFHPLCSQGYEALSQYKRVA